MPKTRKPTPKKLIKRERRRSIGFPDGEYQRICDAARRAGFSVKRGPGSQISEFVLAAVDKY